MFLATIQLHLVEFRFAKTILTYIWVLQTQKQLWGHVVASWGHFGEAWKWGKTDTESIRTLHPEESILERNVWKYKIDFRILVVSRNFVTIVINKKHPKLSELYFC